MQRLAAELWRDERLTPTGSIGMAAAAALLAVAGLLAVLV